MISCLIGYALTLAPVLLAHGQEAASGSKVRSSLQPFVDSQMIAGAVTLVATPQRVVAHEAIGWMDIENRMPMRPDCLFWIASQSKPITCTALMILVEEGKLSVDDRVDRYLPDFADQFYVAEKTDSQQILKLPGQPMLVRHLMSHTSGLPGATLLMKPTLERLPLEQMVAGNAMLALGSEPGTKYLYSNPGINTVGRIIEVVSGMVYEDFLQQRIFDPLGMNDTGFWPSPEQQSRLAKSYRPSADKKSLEATHVNQLYYPLNDRIKRHAFPGGGLFSTAIDLSKFYRMLANDGELDGKRILSAETIRQMTSDQTGTLHAKYGFGFKTDEKSFGHGGAYGTNSTFHRDPKLITIYLIQHSGFLGDGKSALSAFQKAALEVYGKSSTR